MLPQLANAASNKALARFAGDQVHWLPLPPLPRPGKICGIAMNNSASNERKISAPEHPAFFLKPASCLIGHRESIVVRRYFGSVHPEPANSNIANTRVVISQFQTLESGDVISCGTAFKSPPKRRSIHQANLQQVDGPVEVCIETLGTLVNPVVVEERDIGNWRL